MTPEAAELLFTHLSAFLGDPTNRPAEPAAEISGRLSEQALDVLGFAVEDARRLNHNYVGTEHLLLGLVHEPTLPAGHLLIAHGVELTKVRDAVELIIGRGDRPYPGEPRFTPRARKVILLGIEEAETLGDPTAGAEHLLLGIVREGEGIANGILESLLISPEKIRAQVLEALGQPPSAMPGPFRSEGLSRLARKALLQAQLAARWYYHPQVDTEHLLLGLVRERGGAAARALQELGAGLARVLEQFEALTSPASAARPATGPHLTESSTPPPPRPPSNTPPRKPPNATTPTPAPATCSWASCPSPPAAPKPSSYTSASRLNRYAKPSSRCSSTTRIDSERSERSEAGRTPSACAMLGRVLLRAVALAGLLVLTSSLPSSGAIVVDRGPDNRRRSGTGPGPRPGGLARLAGAAPHAADATRPPRVPGRRSRVPRRPIRHRQHRGNVPRQQCPGR